MRILTDGTPRLEPGDHETLNRAQRLLANLVKQTDDIVAARAAADLAAIRTKYPLPAKKAKPPETSGGESSELRAAVSSQDIPAADQPPVEIPSALIDDLIKCQSKARVNSVCTAYLEQTTDGRVQQGIRQVCDRRLAELKA